MTIIISKNGKDAKIIERSTIEKEEYLQEYIHENPSSIPIYEIKENRKLLVVAREYETISGPIDALAVDADGDVYIVETKLYKNTDKRKVVAQALDYGASLWRHSRDFDLFMEKIETEILKKFNISFQEKTMTFFDLDEGGFSELVNGIQHNLNTGTLRFVIMMDTMDERLKDLIVYINQNSNFDIYAVEIEYYNFEDYEIMIPRIYGVEVKKAISTLSTKGNRKKWDRESFIEQSRKLLGGNNKDLIDLMEHCEKEADKITYGTGAVKGSFTPLIYNLHEKRSLLTFISDGSIKIKVNFFIDIFSEERIQELIDLVREFIDPVVIGSISDDRVKRDSFTVDPNMFIEGYDGIKKMIKRISVI